MFCYGFYQNAKFKQKSLIKHKKKLFIFFHKDNKKNNLFKLPRFHRNFHNK